MDESTTPVDGGLSRRDLLKRAATVGAAAWAIPIVSTFNAPAFAQSDESPLCTEDWRCGDPVTLCGEGPDDTVCVCDVTVEGDSFCWNDGPCAGTTPCTSTSDCPPGWGCVTNCCSLLGPASWCFPPCGNAIPEAAQRDGTTGSKKQLTGTGL